MNVLVIGGAGFVGSNLVRRCLQEPENRVTVLDALDPTLHATTEHLRPVWDRIRFVQGNMIDEALIGSLVEGQDLVFNVAAQTSHPLSLKDPIHDTETNCVGNLRVLEAVRRVSPQAKVVYTSSSTVVGRAVGDVIDESHAERPLDIYSANKGVAEKYYRIYHRVHDVKTVVLRFANLYGPYGKGFPEFGFVNYFIHLAFTGKDVTVFGSGAQTRNVLYVGDAVEILYRSAFEPSLVGEVFFAAHEQHLSVLEIAKQIVEVFGRGKLNHVEWPEERKRIEVDAVRVSSRLLREQTGWTPKLDFGEGLRRTREIMEREHAR
ncbi:MAG TPA: NAD-dependent epimerase/dehydratase family protein [Polyangiaceae bacterium]|jgi:nucleoside-diphosphate-sugar epimerase|nr:NAD-dependent epimerase/dehydratase family protein [Polyangiaceae bacterium]